MKLGLLVLVGSLSGCSLILSESTSDGDRDGGPDAQPACASECSAPEVCDTVTGDCKTCEKIYAPDRPTAADLACPSGVCDRAMKQCAMEEEVAYMLAGTPSGAPCTRAEPCPSFDDAFMTVAKPIVFVSGQTLPDTQITEENLGLLNSARVYGYGVEWTAPRPVSLGAEFEGVVHLEGFDINGDQQQPDEDNIGVFVEDGDLILRRVTIRSIQGGVASHGVSAVDARLTVDSCAILDNEHNGINLNNSVFLIRNTVIARNGLHGVRVFRSRTETDTFSFNTIADNGNLAFLCEGDLNGAYAAVGNLFIGSGAIECDSMDSLRFRHSFVPGYMLDPSNLPETVTPSTTSEYRLQQGAGVDVTELLGFVETDELDADGNPRLSGSAPDIGAYELQQ